MKEFNLGPAIENFRQQTAEIHENRIRHESKMRRIRRIQRTATVVSVVGAFVEGMTADQKKK